MNIIRKIKDYIKSVIAELKKVSWAKPRDLFQTTVVVIVLSLVMAIIIFLFDFVFSRLLQLILR
ncbi:MAG: preprotein translocase subunit SecE [candidate division WOR-3 bacterium]